MPDTLNTIRTAPKPACLLCGSSGVPLYTGLRDILFGVPGTWSLSRCSRTGCGLLWLDPAPMVQDLPLAYSVYFTHEHDGNNNQRRLRLRSIAYKGYQSATFIVASLLGFQSDKHKFADMFLGDCRKGKLLDVGCGDGKFLNRMRRQGWTVDGVDFDSKALENAKRLYGLDLRLGDLQSIQFPNGTFDAITLSHVIEHVPDPIALLNEVHRILKPGGRMVLTTPNALGVGHLTYKQHWFGIDPPRHLQVFSVESLRLAAGHTPLRVVQVTSSPANADIFLGGSESIREAAVNGASGPLKPGLKIARAIKAFAGQAQEFAQVRSDPTCGEEAVLICEK